MDCSEADGGFWGFEGGNNAFWRRERQPGERSEWWSFLCWSFCVFGIVWFAVRKPPPLDTSGLQASERPQPHKAK